jgi:hypothetical protein
MQAQRSSGASFSGRITAFSPVLLNRSHGGLHQLDIGSDVEGYLPHALYTIPARAR